MKKSKFTESQIFNILKESETGISVVDICRKHGIGNATFYKWRAKYGGMDASMMKRLKELEDENQRLKRMYANAAMDNEILKETLKKL
jgi:putative transposase